MSIKWKTHTVEHKGETYSVTHWARHDPRKLVDLVHAKPNFTVGQNPPVRVHKFGPHDVAIRTDVYRYKSRFAALAKAAARHASVLETPVALISHNGSSYLVTLWKKKTWSFGVFVCDPQVSLTRKKKACVSVARELARLHAAGFVHLHLKPENVVVDKNGKGKLVDPVLMHEINPLYSIYDDFSNARFLFGLGSLVDALRPQRSLHSRHFNRVKFRRYLFDKYDQYYKKYKAQQDRRQAQAKRAKATPEETQ
ncbi:MAG: hypothetical protein V1644_01525 [Candidatus Micrarchaeota archaeon]